MMVLAAHRLAQSHDEEGAACKFDGCAIAQCTQALWPSLH